MQRYKSTGSYSQFDDPSSAGSVTSTSQSRDNAGSNNPSARAKMLESSSGGNGKYRVANVSLGTRLRALLDEAVLAAKYVHTSCVTDYRVTVVGIATVCIVVFFVTLLENLVLHSPLIFLKLAETQVGEMDALLLPKLSGGAPVTRDSNMFDPSAAANEAASSYLFFNSSWLQERFEGNSMIRGTTPRWILQGSISNPDDPGLSIRTMILIADMEQEEKIGLGRTWPYQTLGYSQASVTGSVLRALKIDPGKGQRATLDLGIAKLLATAGGSPQMLVNLINGVLADISGGDIVINGSSLIPPLPANITPPVLPPVTIPEAVIAAALAGQTEALVESTVDALVNGNALDLTVAVEDAIEDPYGRWPPSLGNVVLLDSKYILQAVKEQMDRLPAVAILNALAWANATGATAAQAAVSTETPLTDSLLGFDLSSYAFMMVVQYEHRLNAYVMDIAGLRTSMAEFSDSLVLSLGINYPVEVTLPLAMALEPLRFLRMFLNQIFTAVVVIITGLGATAIYSLLLGDVSQKTYEYGMLRALGMQTALLAQLLLFRGIYYAVPGLCIGFILAQLVNIPLMSVICEYASVPHDLALRSFAITIGLLLGVLLPIVGNVLPIRRALGRALSESLDVYHQSQSDVTVTTVRLEKLGISPAQTTLSVVLIIIGGLVYYVIPLAFIYQNFDLLLGSLNLILLGSLAGFVLLASIFQPHLEAIFLRCVLWGPDAKYMSLVSKNLAAHRPRSRKTSLMFSTTVAFAVFAGAMFTLQAEAIVGNVKAIFGSDMTVSSNRLGLDEKRLTEYLTAQTKLPKESRLIENFVFATFPLNIVDPPFKWVYASNHAGFPTGTWAPVSAVGSNFLDVVYSEFYIHGDENLTRADGSGSASDIFRAIERPLNQPLEQFHEVVDSSVSGEKLEAPYELEAIVPVSAIPYYSVELGQTMVIRAYETAGDDNEHGRSRWHRWFFRIKGFASKCPGYFFSSYAQTAAGSLNILISEGAYYQMYKTAAEWTRFNQTIPDAPPKSRLWLRLKPGSTSLEREEVENGLRPYLQSDASVTDAVALVETTRGTVDLLLLFFYVVVCVASALCFFILWTSFDANVRENLWQFGVLRSLGLTSMQLVRCYMYEALVMILASLALGASIGFVIAVTLTMQQGLFTEMPFAFTFPTVLFVGLVVMALSVAGLGGYFPAAVHRQKPIAGVLKGK